MNMCYLLKVYYSLVSLQVTSETDYEKLGRILDGIQTVNQFVSFCLVLIREDIGQEHVVTEVMGLTVEEVQRQRSMRE